MNIFEFIGFKKKQESVPEEKKAILYPSKITMPSELVAELESQKKYSELVVQDKLAKINGENSDQSRISQLKEELGKSEDEERKRETRPLDIGPL